MRIAFARIRLQGSQTELVHALTLYLADQPTLPVDHIRRHLKSLTIVIHATPGFMEPEPITWRNLLDLPRHHRLVEEALPGLICQAIQLSLNIDVLALDLTRFNRRQRESFREILHQSQDLPKAKHIRVIGCCLGTSKVVNRCAAHGEMVSLHLYSGIESACGRVASAFQPSLKRLHLLVDTNVNVTGLPTEHLDRVSPTMRPALLEDIASRFSTLEWLVLAPSCTNAPRPFNSQSGACFFEEHVHLFALAIERIPTPERIAFALPEAQIGNRIIRNIWHGPEPLVTQSQRDQWFIKLVRGLFDKAPQLQQVSVIIGPNGVFRGIRKPEELVFQREFAAPPDHLANFPFGLLE